MSTTTFPALPAFNAAAIRFDDHVSVYAESVADNKPEILWLHDCISSSQHSSYLHLSENTTLIDLVHELLYNHGQEQVIDASMIDDLIQKGFNRKSKRIEFGISPNAKMKNSTARAMRDASLSPLQWLQATRQHAISASHDEYVTHMYHFHLHLFNAGFDKLLSSGTCSIEYHAGPYCSPPHNALCVQGGKFAISFDKTEPASEWGSEGSIVSADGAEVVLRVSDRPNGQYEEVTIPTTSLNSLEDVAEWTTRLEATSVDAKCARLALNARIRFIRDLYETIKSKRPGLKIVMRANQEETSKERS